MRILHYSDRGVANIFDLYRCADLFITTGDLQSSDFAGIATLDPKIPAFGVYGNHDDGASYLEDNGITNVHNKVVEYQNLKIGGFQGCLRYNAREMQFTEEEAEVFANSLPYVDILILHAGPYGLLDDPSDPVHTGSKAIRRYVDEKKPLFVFCGHQYSDAYLEFGPTKIFRTYGARVVEVNL